MLFRLLGLTAAFFTSMGFIPQIIKGLKTKHVKDVSLFTLIFSAVGTFLWAIYGVYLADKIIIGANIFTCSTVCVLIIMKYFYRQT